MGRPAPKGSLGRAGFTLIELLIVVAVTTIGFVALADLQTASLRGHKHMNRMYEAVALGENFLEDLRLEFSQWTPSSPLQTSPRFPHLANLPTGSTAQPGSQTPGDGVEGGPGWVIASLPGDDRRVPVAGDEIGVVSLAGAQVFNEGIREATLDPNIPDAQEHFCMLYRLTWLIPNRAMRAEVEVSWPLESADLEEFRECDFSAASRLDRVRSVTLTSTIMVNLFNR